MEDKIIKDKLNKTFAPGKSEIHLLDTASVLKKRL